MPQSLFHSWYAGTSWKGMSSKQEINIICMNARTMVMNWWRYYKQY